MKKITPFFVLAVLVIVGLILVKPRTSFAQSANCRDPLQQPFAANSIWNTPIGSNASFVPAQFVLPSGGYSLEENIIITNPSGPMKTIQQSLGDWGGDRCQTTGNVLYGGKQFPIPDNFSTSELHEGGTPNASTAIYSPNDDKFYQTQPLAVCGRGGTVTSHYEYPTVDARGDGIEGAQGGSGMSSIGGAIRISEMKPGYRIPHALKLIIFGVENISGTGNGYRWPAVKADTGWDKCGSDSNAYCGSVSALKMGALLALPPTVDINSLGLNSASSKMIAQALQEYGGYVVDNSAWSNVHFALEFGPAGDGVTTFESQVGPLNNSELNTIFSKLAVVDNNTSGSIGGGGAPTAPTALPFCDGNNPQPTNPPQSTSTPPPNATPTTKPGGVCTTKATGDADCNGTITLADFSVWKDEYTGTLGADLDGDGNPMDADFSKDGKVTLADYQTWRASYLGSGPSPTTPPAACLGNKASAVTIMPLGDSITAGTDGRGGYRFNLYSLLKGANVNFDLVGTLQDGSVADNDHSGYGGWQAGRIDDTAHGNNQISKSLDQVMGANTPDVVLLFAGTNDKYGGYDNTPWPDTDVAKNIVELAKLVRTRVPNAYIFVSGLTPGGPFGDHDGDVVNTLLATDIPALGDSKIIYASEMAKQITTQYTPDNVHPTAAGYDKMGEVWYGYLKPILVDCK